MPAATTFSHGLCSECTNLPELLQILSTVLQTILTTGKPSRYNNGRDSIAYAASCGYGGIGRRARFRFWCLRRAGSSPVARIKTPDSRRFLLIIFGNNKKCIKLSRICFYLMHI